MQNLTWSVPASGLNVSHHFALVLYFTGYAEAAVFLYQATLVGGSTSALADFATAGNGVEGRAITIS